MNFKYNFSLLLMELIIFVIRFCVTENPHQTLSDLVFIENPDVEHFIDNSKLTLWSRVHHCIKHPFCNKNRDFKDSLCRLTHYLYTKNKILFYGPTSNYYAYKTCKTRQIFTTNGKKKRQVKSLRCYNMTDVEDEESNEFDVIAAKEPDAFFVITRGENDRSFIRAKVENFSFANADAVFAELDEILKKEVTP